MNSDIKISVIIPAYNVAQWLGRCVDSVLAQTHRNLEVLLIDDGSTDETPEIVDSYAAIDPRIVAVHQKNAGLVAVRERGIQLAAGAYVGFVDGDDVVEPDFYQRLLNNAVQFDADISHCGLKYCFYDGREKFHYGTGQLRVLEHDEGIRELLLGRTIEPSLCNKLYRRELLADSCLDTSVVNNEDLLRNFTLFSRARRSVFEDFCGYHYWRRSESMSNNTLQAKQYRDILRARECIFHHADESVQTAALHCYLMALVSGYNAVADSRQPDGAALRQHCKAQIRTHRNAFRAMGRGFHLRALMILYVPAVYHVLLAFHRTQGQLSRYLARKKAQKR